MHKIETLKEKLDACMLEKKYFETFMIESRKENRELKEQLQKGDKQIVEKIKQIAKQDLADKQREAADREKMVSFQMADKQPPVADSPLLAKHYSAQSENPKLSAKYVSAFGADSHSKVLNTHLEMYSLVTSSRCRNSGYERDSPLTSNRLADIDMTKTGYFPGPLKEEPLPEFTAHLNAGQLRRLNANLRKENASLKRALSGSLASKNELTAAVKNCILEVAAPY